MKIKRDQQSKFWVLSSDSRVLYKGRRSPWDDPTIIRQALDRERATRGSTGATPRSADAKKPTSERA
jgi:hypothetical protein